MNNQKIKSYMIKILFLILALCLFYWFGLTKGINQTENKYRKINQEKDQIWFSENFNVSDYFGEKGGVEISEEEYKKILENLPEPIE